ncbi:MAG: Pyrrolo-quinoline quinone [Planctomycetaceae bacterium]|nr:Pyrrolo-quinoline quinone [Planctomycetaceae bacterium]
MTSCGWIALFFWSCAWYGETIVPAKADAQLAQEDWPQFRGPAGQGHGAAAKLPTKWSEIQNVTWKTRIPGSGWSSPVIRGDRIWLTTSLREGSELKLIAVNKTTGKIELEVPLFQVSAPGKIHAKNGHASPTPLLDGDRVYVHFGAYGTACVDQAGKVLWKTGLDYYQHHGPAASPILVGNRLIIPCDGFDKPFYEGTPQKTLSEFQFVAALKADTGEIDWKTVRKAQHSYATPLLIEVDGKPQIISPGADRTVAYNPETGVEIWSVRYTGYSLIPRPVYGKGLVFLCTGYNTPTVIAVKPDGQGDVTDTHVVWTYQPNAPNTPSPILVDDALYFVNDAGIATCLEAETGKEIWKRRLGGNFSASPIYADGKLFFLSEDGTMHVLAPGKQYKRLSVNKLSGMTYASPAVSGNALFLRSDQFLYRIEEKKPTTGGTSKSGKKS